MVKLLCLLLVVSCVPLRRAETVLAVGGATVDVSNRLLHFDVDRGGYQDKWLSSDKLTHATLAYVITDGCGSFGGRRPVCAALSGLGGIGWEFSQGTVSNRDIVANLVGAALNTAIHWRR